MERYAHYPVKINLKVRNELERTARVDTIFIHERTRGQRINTSSRLPLLLTPSLRSRQI